MNNTQKEIQKIVMIVWDKFKKAYPKKLFFTIEQMWRFGNETANLALKSGIKIGEQKIEKDCMRTKNWGIMCATQDNRNQCCEKWCILYPICKIKVPVEKAKQEKTQEIKEKIEKEINNLNKKENYSLEGKKKYCCQAELMVILKQIGGGK